MVKNHLIAYVTTGPTKAPSNALVPITGAWGTPHWWIAGIIGSLLIAVVISMATSRRGASS
jgi:hypothetical protein